MNAKVMTITPEMAAEWLKSNANNRPLNQNRVDRYVQAIKRGEWRLNGETIIRNGSRLLDGQHRLTAVVTASLPITSFVVDGMPEDVFPTLGQGDKRSHGDVLSIQGEKNTHLVAAALKVVDQYLTGRSQKKVVYSAEQVRSLLEAHPEIRQSATRGQHTRGLLTPSIMVAAHYLFSRLDEAAADVFVRDLVTGTGLIEGDGVYFLRERLVQNTLSKSKLNNAYLFALTIKAWNARRTNTVVRNLRWREEGPTAEAFPIIR